jgi:hypothetical protein
MFDIRHILTIGCIASLGACIASAAQAAEPRELTSRIFMPTADQMTLNDVQQNHALADGPSQTVSTRTNWKSDLMLSAVVASLQIRHGRATLFRYRPEALPGADATVALDGKGIHLVLSFPPYR